MNTIRHRLTRRLLFWEAGLLLMGATLAFLVMRNALTRQFDNALRTKLMALASAVEQDNGRVNFDTSDQLPRQFDTANPALFFQIWDSHGHEVARSKSLPEELPSSGLRAAQDPQPYDLRLTNGLSTRVASLFFHPAPANQSGATNGPLGAIAVVAADRRELDSTLATVTLVLAGLCGVVLVLTGLVVPSVLRREHAPLYDLAEQARDIDAESLTERFSTEGMPGELVPIGERFNELLGRLQTAFARERQFTDDLAHEFRTPIAELRSLAEVSLQWPSTRHGDADAEVLAIAVQMETMINRLLSITRGDQGRLRVERQPVDLAELTASVWSTVEPRAVERGLASKLGFISRLEIRSDPALLRSILTNLLDNAVEYAVAPSILEVTASVLDNRFTLSVTNAAQNLDPKDLPSLFERFWRKDPARSGSEHSGLGLPLALAFASSIGCTLVANLSSDHQLTLTLSGPANLFTSTQPQETPILL